MNSKEAVLRLIAEKGLQEPFLLAIDGRCTSGKTTLAKELAKELGCNLVHTDDFYLPFSERTSERMAQPHGHMDVGRLLKEVLIPLSTGKEAFYCPYDCHSDDYTKEQRLNPKKSTIVEGSYSCAPELRELYSLRVFMNISPEKQMERLILRSAETAENFCRQWIPREEFYFSECRVKESCDLIIEN